MKTFKSISDLEQFRSTIMKLDVKNHQELPFFMPRK
jgi:hypothetical protein